MYQIYKDVYFLKMNCKQADTPDLSQTYIHLTTPVLTLNYPYFTQIVTGIIYLHGFRAPLTLCVTFCYK